MDYYDISQELVDRLRAKGYKLMEGTDPLDVALVKPGALMQTYVIALRDASRGSEDPDTTFQRTQEWFRSIFGNNGAGLLIFIYPEAPAWAVEQIKNGGSGEVKGAVIDLHSNYRWAPSHLGWDSEIFS